MSWKFEKIIDCCTKVGSGSTPKGGSAVYVDKGTSLIRSQNVYNLSFKYDGLAYINEQAADKLKGVSVEEGDILLNITGDSVARSCIVPIDVLPARVNQHVAIIRTNKEKLDSRFLNYYLVSPYMQAFMLGLAVGKGASRNAMTKGMIENFDIPCPDIPTQKNIVSILSAYDDLIDVNKKQIKLLEEAAELIYKEWFVKFRFPGFETKLFIDGLPQGWKKEPLSTVLDKITTGLNPRDNFVLGNGSNFYVTIKNMSNNYVYLDDRCDKVDDAALEKINKRSDLREGDILFSGIGTIGRVFLVSFPTNNWNVSESVFTMRANHKITKEYLYMVLLSDDLQNYCEQNAHGAAQKGIRMGDLKAYKILLPDDEILRKFTNEIKSLIDKVQMLHEQNKHAAEARDILLPRLMSGVIEV